MTDDKKLKSLQYWKKCILQERELLDKGLEQVLYQIYLIEKDKAIIRQK